MLMNEHTVHVRAYEWSFMKEWRNVIREYLIYKEKISIVRSCGGKAECSEEICKFRQLKQNSSSNFMQHSC